MTNLWKRLAGLVMFQHCFIENEGGGASGGGTSSGGDSGGTGSGAGASTASLAAEPSTASQTAPKGDAAPLSTQEVSSRLTDDGGKPVRELGESSEAFMGRYREWRNANPVTEEPAAKTPEQIAAEAEAKKVADAAKTTTQETAEQKADRERKAAEAAKAETPEAKAAREATEKTERERLAALQPGGEEWDLAPIPTETLAAAIKAHPVETAAFLTATGLTEDQLFANSRLAGRAGEYAKVGLPTIEAAKHAVTRARAFHHLDDSFTNLKKGDLAGTGKFLSDVLLPLSYLRDENGQVRVDPDSKMPLTDGSVFTFLDNAVDVRHDFWARTISRDASPQAIGSVMGSPAMSKILDAVVEVGKKLGGDQGDMLEAAALTLKGCGKAGSPSGEGEMSPEVKARLEEADRLKEEAARKVEEVNERESVAFQTKVNTFKDTVLTESSTGIDKIIDNYLDGTSLKDDKFVRETVKLRIRNALYDHMAADELYLSQRDAITLGGPNASTHKKWLALNLDEAKARLRSVSEPIFTEAGVQKLTKDAKRKAQIDLQQKNSQMETKGGTSISLPSAGPAALDKHQLIEKARENLRTRGEDAGDSALVLKEYRKLSAAPAA